MIAGNLNGLFAPPACRRPIVDQIAEATRRIMADAEFQRILVTSGFEPILDSGPDATRQFIAAETTRWTPIMKATGFKMVGGMARVPLIQEQDHPEFAEVIEKYRAGGAAS